MFDLHTTIAAAYLPATGQFPKGTKVEVAGSPCTALDAAAEHSDSRGPQYVFK